jgi:hypothetical protein
MKAAETSAAQNSESKNLQAEAGSTQESNGERKEDLIEIDSFAAGKSQPLSASEDKSTGNKRKSETSAADNKKFKSHNNSSGETIDID